MSLTRRLFLRNSAVGALASAVAVPIIAEASQPDAAMARARFHYDQLTTGYHGWLIGGGHRREFSAPGCHTIEDASWLGPKLVTYEAGTDPRCPSGVVEWNHDIIGLQKQPSRWLDEPLYRDGKGVRL
ncbi:twin-arginine translocation signal domain-containing protein [Mesorhizobium sp. M0387]|uniref:twin-arginine translocation signal domain-containing protein n=1 Tax=Mesorhizobium sp. M0387 TaxID=2956940 RepID=UPI00333C7253